MTESEHHEDAVPEIPPGDESGQGAADGSPAPDRPRRGRRGRRGGRRRSGRRRSVEVEGAGPPPDTAAAPNEMGPAETVEPAAEAIDSGDAAAPDMESPVAEAAPVTYLNEVEPPDEVLDARAELEPEPAVEPELATEPEPVPAPAPPPPARPLRGQRHEPRRHEPRRPEPVRHGRPSAAVPQAIDHVKQVIRSLEESLVEMEKVLEILEEAEREKTDDEREIGQLRRLLDQLKRGRPGSHSSNYQSPPQPRRYPRASPAPRPPDPAPNSE